MFNLRFVLIIVFSVFGKINATDDLIVQLPKGKIRGHILKSESGKPYYAFQEIPYAAPPIGINRFQVPKDPQPWSGVLNTTKNTVICYQETVEHNKEKSEDCLFINVYTPKVPGTTKSLPVLVWIHGGGFYRRSSTFEYVGPKYVVDHDVVVVAFNYRLGPFGFLTTDDEVMPANLGLKDQHFALEWVHENIVLFGGNNSHVTIAGESAGGMSVALHLLGPWQNNKVLYHAAIIQSGSGMFHSSVKNLREEAFRLGHYLNNSFSSENSKDLLRVLQKAPAADILAASRITSWAPFIEKDGMFKYQLSHSIEIGNIKKIPVIIGFNSEERITDGLNPNLRAAAAAYDKDPSKMISSSYNISAINKSILGKLLTKIYTNTSFEENISAYIRYGSDNMASTPAIKTALLQSKITDLYLYQFSYKGKLGMNMNLPYIPGCDRVAHAEDLNYLWDSEVNSDLSKFPQGDGLMLHRFVKLWTNFVKYHNPTPEKDALLQNITWPKIDPNTPESIQYLNMNTTLEVRANPRYFQKVIKVWDQYITSEVIN